jgi:hypothetical protein
VITSSHYLSSFGNGNEELTLEHGTRRFQKTSRRDDLAVGTQPRHGRCRRPPAAEITVGRSAMCTW